MQPDRAGAHRPLTRLDRFVMSDAWAITAAVMAVVSLIVIAALLVHLSARPAQTQCEREVRGAGACRGLEPAA